MNPVRLLVLLVSLPLFFVGCGGNDEVTDETKPKLQSVNYGELRLRGSLTSGIIYRKGSDTPYTGKAFEFYDNGQKEFEQYYKEGKRDGLSVWWWRNGQKQIEQNFKDGILDGLQVQWHRNGQKAVEGNFKDGKMQWKISLGKRKIIFLELIQKLEYQMEVLELMAIGPELILHQVKPLEDYGITI